MSDEECDPCEKGDGSHLVHLIEVRKDSEWSSYTYVTIDGVKRGESDLGVTSAIKRALRRQRKIDRHQRRYHA